MGLRRRKYISEDIRHRELPFGTDASINMHLNTIRALERSSRRSSNPSGYKRAIEAHRAAAKMYRALGEGPSLVRDIRAAKKAAREAHLLTRAL